MIVSLRDFLFGGRAAFFYPFETRIIEEVRSRLGAEASVRLQSQVEKINKLQRLANGKEVNLYHMLHGKPAFDDNLRFPDASDEALLASASLICSEKPTKLKVELWLAKGRLFSLVYNKPPKQFFADADLKSVRPEIVDVKIWFDPMHPHPTRVDKPIDSSTLTGWLREWRSKGRVTDLRKPLLSAEREALLGRIDAQLPPDYLELAAQTDGAKLMTCTVHGVAGIRKIVWPEKNFYILAEIEGHGALAVQEGSQDAMLYFLDYEDNEARPVGKSFKDAVTDFLKVE